MRTSASRAKPVRGEAVEFLEGPADGVVMRARPPLPARVRYPMPADHVYVRRAKHLRLALRVCWPGRRPLTELSRASDLSV